MLLLIPLVIIAFARVKEIAAVLFGRAPRPPARRRAPRRRRYAPKVSIHIPAYMEPPEMLRQTLDAVARLDYPNFECVVVINNTPDPAYWRPVEEHCRTLGARFKFINAEKLAGYKAGALRLALAHTAPDAEIIGIIDADYAVHPDWLKDVVPAFADPKVGLIQAPQDHRDESTPLHWAMNGEYAGFFDIGMVQRNEENAIIVHGTMCLIRRSALDAAGGWSSDTICEDTDLGLTIIEQGWTTLYTRRRYGHGLLPDTFEAFKKQRHRWAYGGLQIIRKHWRRFLPGVSLLTRDQKREFAVGWLNWLGAESVGVLVAIFNLVWVPVVAFMGIAIPDKVLTLPIMAAFVVSLAHFVTLYRRRVAISPAKMAAAMVAAMSMQWTVARAVAMGLVTEHLPFVRTAKGGSARKKRLAFPAFYEAVMGGLLIVGAVIVFATNLRAACARSTCSATCWWCRACRSSPPPRWRWSRRPASTASRSGTTRRCACSRRSPRCCRAAPPSSPCRRPRRRPRTRWRARSVSRAQRSIPSLRSAAAEIAAIAFGSAQMRAETATPHPGIAVSTSRAQYDVPIGITSSLKS